MNATIQSLIQYAEQFKPDRTPLTPRGFTYIRGRNDEAGEVWIAAYHSNFPPSGVCLLVARRSPIMPIWWIAYRNSIGGGLFIFEGYCAEKRDGTFVQLESFVNVFGMNTYPNHASSVICNANEQGPGDTPNINKCINGTATLMETIPEPPYFDVLYQSLRKQLRSLQQLSTIGILEQDPTIWQEDGADEMFRELVERPEDGEAASLLIDILIRRDITVDTGDS